MTRPATVFDLDGTLVDTAPDLLAALNVVLADADVAPISEQLGRRMIGHGAKAMIAGALRHHGLPITEERLAPMHEQFLDFYTGNIAVHSRPFPDVVETLDRLAAAGVALAVCTNKLEMLARQLLDELGLSHRFAAIVGPDTLDVRKPDPGHVLGAIDLAGGDPLRAVMVGDSGLDVTAARRAEIFAVAVDFGYPEEPVETLGADAVISHFEELWNIAAPRLGIDARQATSPA